MCSSPYEMRLLRSHPCAVLFTDAEMSRTQVRPSISSALIGSSFAINLPPDRQKRTVVARQEEADRTAAEPRLATGEGEEGGGATLQELKAKLEAAKTSENYMELSCAFVSLSQSFQQSSSHLSARVCIYARWQCLDASMLACRPATWLYRKGPTKSW